MIIKNLNLTCHFRRHSGHRHLPAINFLQTAAYQAQISLITHQDKGLYVLLQIRVRDRRMHRCHRDLSYPTLPEKRFSVSDARLRDVVNLTGVLIVSSVISR